MPTSPTSLPDPALSPSSPASPSSPSSLGHLPTGDSWAFDESVTTVFDDMLLRSIPDYQSMRDLTTALALDYVQDASSILDLGCSRGDALAPLIDRFGARNRYVGIDVSAPMLAAARARFATYAPGMVRIEQRDLRDGIPYVNASVILSVLTLMFTPINYRQSLIQQCYDTLIPGGALFLVEKFIGETAVADRLLVDHYHRLKAEHGYSREEIERKRLALEGVQVPVTAKWNIDMLRSAGFTTVEGYWRHLNFGAFIAVKRGGRKDVS